MPRSVPAMARAAAQWEIRAGGTPEECVTLLNIVLPDGNRIGGGGHGGHALPPGRPLSFSVHQADSGVHYLVGRVAPNVEHVDVEFVQTDRPALNLEDADGRAELTGEPVRGRWERWSGPGGCSLRSAAGSPAPGTPGGRRGT